MLRRIFLRRLIFIFLCTSLAGCAGQQSSPISSANNVSSGAGSYKVGQPYQIAGEWYYPREDYSYDETGVASWYGADFHGQRTANGEMFNKNELTAAHKTLPLPTLARITNLENGRSIVVRINDRGPFSGSRIVDMSQRAAQLLGFEAQGTAKVRVQVLADESKAIADAMRHYGSTTQVASASPASVESLAAEPNSEPANLSSPAIQPVQSETLDPVRTTPETHRELLQTKPVPEVVMVPVPTTSRLFVQAGAFTVAENAGKLQQGLVRFGPSSITSIQINGTKFYRVRLGPISDVPHADALLNQLKKNGISGARTVVE